MSSHILGEKDVNAAMEQQQLQTQTKDVKSMDYHRQVFQNKMAEEPYVYQTTAAAAAASCPTRWTTTTTASSAANTNSSDASSSSSSLLIFDSPSSSPTPSITLLPRWPANRIMVARSQQYVSPSDNIMSPCTAKINALRNKHVSKYVYSIYIHPHHQVYPTLTSPLSHRAKPKSLFAQASAKKLGGAENLFGSKSIPKA
ncbi:hypothetical protein NQ176_g10007 [Zarea fungicola]|uniref:Uncharacterized protein n=1 Tax=Zarea fungicola TaxID=93591 RepID=A0ACC1MJD8_9HYPO|nr:hypothetical protein NQ176_g10007 [Lecanicillium fungicola]